MIEIKEKGKVKEDDNILENIYQTDKKLANAYSLRETIINKEYLIGRQTIVKLPKDKDFLKYYILCPQIVDSSEESIEIIEVNQRLAKISFYIYKNNYSDELFNATFDSLTKTWDVRLKEGKRSIPSNLEEALSTIEKNKYYDNDGILYSETFREMIRDTNHLFESNIEKTL